MSSPLPDEPTGVIRVNLIPVQLNKDVKINRSKYVSLVLSNIQLLHNKDTLLLDHLVEEKADLCSVTETWLPEQDNTWLSCCDIVCNGYKISNVNRQGRHRGGLALIYKQSITIKTTSKGVNRSFEHAIWNCSISNTMVTLVGIYHPPYNETNRCTDAMILDDLAEFLEGVLTLYSNIIIAGDFNLHIDDIANPGAQVFLDILTALACRIMLIFLLIRANIL